MGTAALAIWSYLRWPGAAPATFKGAIVRVLLAWVVLQIGASVIQLGVETVPSIGILVVVGAVVPVLTYAFLAPLWFMKVCADQMGVGK